MTKKKNFVPFDKQGVVFQAKLKQNFTIFYDREEKVGTKQADMMIEELKQKGVHIENTRKNRKKDFELFDY